MGRRNLGFLHRNRHATFNFRWRPPIDVAALFGQPIYTFSLATKSRDEAWLRSAPAIIRAKALIATVRDMAAKKKGPNGGPLFKVELIRSFIFPDGGEERVDYDPSKPGEAEEADRIIANARKLAEQMQATAAKPVQHRAPEPVATVPRRGPPTIGEAFKRFCAEKRSTNAWKDPDHMERYDYGPIVKALVEVAGDRAIASVSVQHLRSFKDKVLAEPGSPTNKGKKLDRLKTFLDWAREVEELTTVSTAILRLPKGQAQAKPYEPFSDDDLKLLFESQAYEQQSFARAFEFWIPMLGLYTGARINELAQLEVSDLVEQDGVPVLCINDEEYKGKTRAATRKVPLHPALIEAGFLEYHALIQAEGWTRLFPELSKAMSKKNKYGKEPSEFFTAYRRACGVSRDKDRHKVFHSFRATANTKLRYAGVDQERRERLIGHESEDVNNKHYRPSDLDMMFPMTMLLEDLKKLEFGLRHPRYVSSAAHRTQRLTAARRRIRRNEGEPADHVVGSKATGN